MSQSPEQDASAADQFVEEPDESEVEEIERARAERLDPDHRPDDAEVDNTQREFDAQKGMFTDSEGYDGSPAPFPPPAEQGA